MLRGICKLPSLKDISPLIISEQTCFLSQKSKIKSAEHVPMSLHLPLRYWILCFDGHQSVGPWAYETQYLFLMTPKTFFFLCSCLSWNQLPVWIKKELFFSMNKIEEKMGIWHSGVLKARARAFVWVFLP